MRNYHITQVIERGSEREGAFCKERVEDNTGNFKALHGVYIEKHVLNMDKKLRNWLSFFVWQYSPLRVKKIQQHAADSSFRIKCQFHALSV